MANTITAIKRQTNETLRNDIWRACDILRRDNNVGGVMEYTEHLAWLLFLKFLDEEEKKRTTEAYLTDKPYERVIPEDLSWDSWAGPLVLNKWKADELIQFVRGRLLPGLATLSGSPLARTVARIFSDESVGDLNVVRSVPVCASGYNLKDVLEIINTIRFDSDTDIYTISEVYEGLLERMGNENRIAGEFYTPRPVIKFMVEVIDPQIGETVYDPAVGSAGFLVAAYDWMKDKVCTAAQRELLQRQTFYGQEKKGLSALLGTMNMVLHGVATPNIRRANTLEESMTGSVSGRYDVILTNPPFGGKEGRHIQENFTVRANATELLFLQHIIKKLKQSPVNARAAMVVPEGTLFRGGAFAEVKKDLLEQFHLFAVVSLPPGTFAPYSDVKTALLFFQRPDEVLTHNPLARYETWYYELPLPEELKKFSKGSKIQDEHFAEAREMWRRWRAYLRGEAGRPFPLADEVRSAWQAHHNDGAPKPAEPYTSWVETLDDLKARGYDLSARNPNQDDRVTLPHPAELTARLLERTRELHSILENLHEMVSNGAEE
ncbi:MAG TPA: restriction endonuclease subunit M [Chloroflexi bacterium]|nr:restriction endonuclease subunit M [Chloroflexota bacterium]